MQRLSKLPGLAALLTATMAAMAAFYFIFLLAPALAVGLFLLGWWVTDRRNRPRGHA